MNKRPVSYLQTDSRWRSKPYRVTGENDTIGESGCGPACAAMAIATLSDPSVTPLETCKWSMTHGYKALNQGTYYSYFRPQLAAFGIVCEQLLPSRIINQPMHPIHQQVKEYLAQGNYVIALMGPGTWTSSGHFVLLWGWDDKVHINDPASTKTARLNGDSDTFCREARCYWLVDAHKYHQEDEDMPNISDLTDAQVTELWTKLTEPLKDNDAGTWSEVQRQWAIDNSLIVGDGATPPNFQWKAPLTREAMCVMLYRFAQLMGKL